MSLMNHWQLATGQLATYGFWAARDRGSRSNISSGPGHFHYRLFGPGFGRPGVEVAALSVAGPFERVELKNQRAQGACPHTLSRLLASCIQPVLSG